MTAEALEIPPKPYTGEKARLTRAYDYLILVLALFLFIGAFHLHVALTAGDWDIWVDWKGARKLSVVAKNFMLSTGESSEKHQDTGRISYASFSVNSFGLCARSPCRRPIHCAATCPASAGKSAFWWTA
jgi:hypothetical protein